MKYLNENLLRMAQSSNIEIEERDQANNLVATYIRSSAGRKGDGGGRIDVVVSRL